MYGTFNFEELCTLVSYHHYYTILNNFMCEPYHVILESHVTLLEQSQFFCVDV